MSQARVIYEYTADGDAQISIKKGETITIMGDVTPENWVLVKNSEGQEGYIPAGYYKEIGGQKPGKVPPKPPTSTNGSGNTTDGNTNTTTSTGEEPPWAKNKAAAASSSKTVNKSRSDDGTLMEGHDTYNLFAYQMEWSAISLTFVNALLSFFNASAQATWYWIIPPIFALTVVGILILLIGFSREKITPQVRAGLFIFLGILMALSWPFGWAACGACFIAGALDIMVMRNNCKPLSSVITDDWRAQFMNGCDSWTPGRLLFVAFVVILDIVSIAWGFINGYNQATAITDNPDAAELKPQTYGVALGFGRVVTMNIAVMLLLACYGCFVRQSRKHERDRTADTLLGRCCGHLSDDEGRRYCHRILAYSIVLFGYLHSIAMYYTYESSGVERTYVSIFGIETVVTGILVFILLAWTIGGANQTILKQNSKLFLRGHSAPAVLMIVILFFHGPKGRGQWYYMPVLGPFVLYCADLALRWFAGDN